MKETLPTIAFASSSGLTTPLRGGDESTTWLGSEEQSLNGKLLKARKPYTITKQRERWSDEEHLRFVEALRLHGRAWRKIEEHIGTKTAVQIRSHAQKFFNKLEKKKEAGENVEQEEDLTIPPPRPKRKPAKPYPRKDAFSASGAADTSHFQYSSAELQAAQQQLLGSYGSAPTGAASTATQHFGNFINTFAGHSGSSTVSDATVAAVTAAASAAAAAAAAAVVAAAGQEVQTHMQAHPPSCFPFFGMPPSALTQITPAHGVSALDQAALIGPHAAAAAVAAKAVAYDRLAGSVKHEGMVIGDPMGGLAACGADRGLMEATGTTDGTHISAGAQACGSDGESSCSETDDQNAEDDDPPNTSWQTRHILALQHQEQQHNGSGSSAAVAAACSLAAAAAQGGFDLSQFSWGLGRQEYANSAAGTSSTTAAQALALLSNPFYQAGLAAVDRTGQQSVACLQAATAAACDSVREANQAAAVGLTRSTGGAIGSSSALDAAVPGVSGRTRSRKTAPSGNSGSTGPPAGTKRLFAIGSEECSMPIKKVAREATDDTTDADGMEGTPSSPSIQEKETKAASQPSNTNGNTSGSNESEGSKRRHGTAQAEGSNPTHGNSSGNGCSVKDSNTGTNTATNGHTNGGNGYSSGNGTSAFNPVGHHHAHHPGATHHAPKANYQQQPGTNGVTSRHQHHRHHSNRAVGAEGSTAANGASGIGFTSGRDEGRSSSDLEGPAQQPTKSFAQLRLQRSAEADDEVMVPVTAADLQEQQQDSEQATQLQSLLASLHGMCSNPLMMRQAYDAASAAAAAAQQIVASAVQGNQQQGVSAQQQIAALQQQICQRSAVATTSQGFAPWHGTAAEYGAGGSSSLVSNGLLQHLGQSPAAQQLQAAAGLMGLAGTWGTAGAPPAAGGTNSLLGTYAQLAAAATAAQQQQQQQHTHQHQHSHYHYHQQQQQQQQQAGSAAVAAAAVGLQQLQQGFKHSSASEQAAGLSSLGGYSRLSGLEVLTRIAAAAPEAKDATQRRTLSHQDEVSKDVGLAKRSSRTL